MTAAAEVTTARYAGPLHVLLYVSDVPASVQYYRRVFGCEFKGYWDPVKRRAVDEWTLPTQPEDAEIRIGTSRIGLQPANVGGRVPTSGLGLAVPVSSAALQARTIRDNGADAADPAPQAWGAQTVTTTDVNGIEWTFVEGDA